MPGDLHFAGELWGEPTPTTMGAADGSLSSIGANYAAHLALGWRMFDRFYGGAESQVYGGDGYPRIRFSLHITRLKTGPGVEWSEEASWAIDSHRRSSPYVRLNVTSKTN